MCINKVKESGKIERLDWQKLIDIFFIKALPQKIAVIDVALEGKVLIIKRTCGKHKWNAQDANTV